MCGRFALNATKEELEQHFGATVPDPYVARYNITPGTPLLAITDQSLTFFNWGLIPGWMRDVKSGRPMINARAETISEKPSFKNAFKRRRCLIPASGFYEWKSSAQGKQPYYLYLPQALFSFAGIWELWQDGMGNEVQTCALLTTEAIGPMSEIHHRMPVIIRPENYSEWLDHRTENLQQARDCIALLDADFSFHEVSQEVNSAGNDYKKLIQPMVK